MKISNILEAAVGQIYGDPIHSANRFMFSCNAIRFVEDGHCRNPMNPIIKAGLTEMGLDCGSGDAFNDCYAHAGFSRALWLTWAALMAKEQGL